MIFSLFGKKDDKEQPEQAQPAEKYVRPMEPGDIGPVLEIIYDHDEDDGEEAEESLNESIEDMFVAIDNGKVIGVTGAIQDEEAEGIVWLSWTYVHEDYRRQGVGRYMVEGMLHALKEGGMRKMYMSTGEYYEDGEDIYAAAKAFYRRLGARPELKIDDYYEVGEARHILGLDIIEPRPRDDNAATENGELVFDGLFEAEETDEGLALTWMEYIPEEHTENPKEVLQRLMEEAKAQQGIRFVIARFPSDLAGGAVRGLKSQNFSSAGKLNNYYDDGIDQLVWINYFQPSA